MQADRKGAETQANTGISGPAALRSFLMENRTSLREIHFVIYGSPQVLQLMVSGSIAEA
jgi:hypothetical protein